MYMYIPDTHISLVLCAVAPYSQYLSPLQRAAHPHGLYYSDVVPPPPDSQGRNIVVDFDPTPYATILPHATTSTDNPLSGEECGGCTYIHVHYTCISTAADEKKSEENETSHPVEDKLKDTCTCRCACILNLHVHTSTCT